MLFSTATTNSIGVAMIKSPFRRVIAVAAGLGIVSSLLYLPTSSAAAGTDTLNAYETLANEQAIRSSNGYTFVMQGDGNAVIYKPTAGGRTAIWSTKTPGRSNSYLAMQSDGNLVLYSNGVAYWATGMKGAGSYLVMQTDGNLVMYRPSGNSRVAVWASNTAQASTPTPATTIVVATYNQAGGADAYPNGYKTTFATGTSFIGTQEVCQLRLTSTDPAKSVRDPQPMIRSFGYTKPGCGTSGPGYGNAVRAAWTGAYEPAINRVFAQKDPTGDPRGVVCQRGVISTRWATFCSTHLTAQAGIAQDDARRNQQIELLAFVDQVRRPGDLIVISGDFNSRPASRMISNTLGLVRATPTDQIDQIWTNATVLRSFSAVPCSPSRCSDHNIWYATLRIR